MLFKRLSFYLAVLGVAGTVYLVQKMAQKPPPPPPAAEPSRSPYPSAVAATGMIESTRENVKVATLKAGLVQKVHVEVGSKVKQGDPLFQIDDRESRARLATAEAQVATLKANLVAEKVTLADVEDQFQRVNQLQKQNIASDEERIRKQFAVEAARAGIEKILTDIRTSEAQVAQAKVDLEVLTVRASRDGTILQVNLRAGEHASLTPNEPLMILGDTDTLQIRADVDEQNAPRVEANQPAVAFLKGDTLNPMPLRFVRIEPYVIPKRSLTGDSAERVDTRVLQIIFQMDRPTTPIYVGQQVDVFIQRSQTKQTERAVVPSARK